LVFKCAGSFDTNSPLYVTWYHEEKLKRIDLFTTKLSLKSHNTKKHSVYYFEPFELYSNQFAGPLEEQNVHFEIINVKEFLDGRLKEIVMGSSSVDLKPIVDLDHASLLQLKIIGKDEQLVGKLSFGHSRLRPMLSFLDYKIDLNLDFIPVIAIDYSLSNKIDGDKWISDYIPVINHIMNAYKDISRHWMGYGFGAKTCPSQALASDIFSLSGNMFDPTIPYNHLIECYEETKGKVEMAFPVNFMPVLEHVKRYAKHEFDHHRGRNYYWLFYITPGVLDDVHSSGIY
jgi:hypothetical protein